MKVGKGWDPMAVMKLRVTYLDGRQTTVVVSPRAQVMTEERYSGVGNEVTALRVMYYLAWASLNRSGQEPDDFETWLDKISDVEDAEDKPDPTIGGSPQPAPSSPRVSRPASPSMIWPTCRRM